MSRRISQNELDDILMKLDGFMNGASIEELRPLLKLSLPRYTLQRRLALLVKEGKIYTIGRGRALKYRTVSSKVNKDIETVQKEGSIPLTKEAELIQKKVCQPIQARVPVGYNRGFLDDYRPNETFYLTESLRTHLFDMGNSPNGERPAGTFARQIFNRLLIDLSWNSSRLEGNTYSLLETERLLKLSEVVQGKDLKEARMILNHKEAIEFLVDSADNIGINRRTILNLHALLSNDLLGDLGACGRLRSIPVGIAKTVYHPLSIPHIIEECFQQILDTAEAVHDPFEQAFFLMVHIPYLQPFEDVNKRVSRLAANIPLIRKNLCPLSFVDVPQHIYVNGLLGVYELNRIELYRDVFLWAYQRSCQIYLATRKELGEPDPLRMRYRELISQTIAHIVHHRMNKTTAIAVISEQARKSVPIDEQTRFIETVEKDIMSMHEGNYSRHRLQYSEFEAWKKNWN